MDTDEIKIDKLKDVEEFKSILLLYDEAKAYLEEYPWCKQVIKGWYDTDFGVYEKIGTFLFNIEPINETVDDHVWVIIGDIPTVYLDKSVKTAKDALTIYCNLMTEWADNIISDKSINECYPVEAEPTIDNAQLLKKKVAFIRRELLQTTD